MAMEPVGEFSEAYMVMEPVGEFSYAYMVVESLGEFSCFLHIRRGAQAFQNYTVFNYNPYPAE